MQDPQAHHPYPTRRQLLGFAIKSRLLQAWRMAREGMGRPPRHANQAPSPSAPQGEKLLAEIRSPLWRDDTPHERLLQMGKVANLRLAGLAMSSLHVPAGRTFSFWRQVGAPWRIRGFARGRELREGCIIPTTGGGLCQLSNALYQAALQAGLTVLERHAHTLAMPDSAAEQNRDATVFWNYVDLRFTAAFSWRLRVDLSDCELIVRISSAADAAPEAAAPSPPPTGGTLRMAGARPGSPGSCASCGELACFLNIEHERSQAMVEKTAWLVDERWPEFDAWMQGQERHNDLLLLPIDGAAWKRPNYAWTTTGFGEVIQHRRFTLLRSLASRRLAGQGAERQKALLRHEARLARLYAKKLRPEHTRLVVSQNLLPHLEKLGALGGRRIDVLLTRAPLASLQATLDLAARRHPDSATLGDFRADPALVQAETRAMERAAHVITPHRALALPFGERVILLDWVPPSRPMPACQRQAGSTPRIGFLGPTLGRKGAWEAREALGALRRDSFHLSILGANLEGPDFWAALEPEYRSLASPGCFADLDIILAPAWVDHSPRRLIALLQAGHRVVAATACGLPPQAGLTMVEPGDGPGLARALATLTASSFS